MNRRKKMSEEKSVAERLKELDEEKKALKLKAKEERSNKIKSRVVLKEARDKRLSDIRNKLNQIQTMIFKYKKLGKNERMSLDILGEIAQEAKNA